MVPRESISYPILYACYTRLTINYEQSQGGGFEYRGFTRVVPLVALSRAADHEVALGHLATLGHHGYPAPAIQYSTVQYSTGYPAPAVVRYPRSRFCN